ncbi:hypothetical protein [Pseudomonas sp. GXM4]|uniref:hypothetical protein n=1 Tax=Pseudomonas sp. GXM4 TaxID=2651867 RepID=UPI001C4999D2|nr:hypothetical protein [Pseudomonas sp. GXM4]
MVINGFESEPDECFSDEEVWEQYQEMSGCQQAAFRAKLCWAAMVAAAPAPDTHNAAPEDSAGVDFGIDGRSVRVSQEAYSIFLAREAAAREKIEALQQRLNAADQRIDELAQERESLIAYGRNNGLHEASTVCSRMAYDTYYPAGSRFKHFVPKALEQQGNLLIKAANAIAALPDGPIERHRARQQKKAEKSATA